MRNAIPNGVDMSVQGDYPRWIDIPRFVHSIDFMASNLAKQVVVPRNEFAYALKSVSCYQRDWLYENRICESSSDSISVSWVHVNDFWASFVPNRKDIQNSADAFMFVVYAMYMNMDEKYSERFDTVVRSRRTRVYTKNKNMDELMEVLKHTDMEGFRNFMETYCCVTPAQAEM